MSTVSAQGILPAKLFPIEWSNMRLIVALSLLASSLQAQNAVKASRFHVEHPTLFNLGFEWAIEGDANRYAVYHAMDLNFALKANSKAVDAGAVIPTINEDFSGRAPDLGALESGKPVPHYGPRWLTWQPFYR